jgi:hypothetical protein
MRIDSAKVATMDVARRLARLERSAWIWRAAALTLLLTIGAGVVMGAGEDEKPTSTERIVSAQSFRVLDMKGRERARLGVEDGFAGLTIKNRRGRVQASFSTGAGGDVSIDLHGIDGRPMARIGTKGDVVSLQFADMEGHTRLRLYGSLGGGCGLVFQEDPHKPRYITAMLPNGKTQSMMKEGDRILWSAP